MAWIKEFHSTEEAKKIQTGCIFGMAMLEAQATDEQESPAWMQLFKTGSHFYAFAAGTEKQIELLLKLGFVWNKSGDISNEMQIVFETVEVYK